MVKRIHAFKTIFNLLLSVVELLIGLGFLMNMLSSSESMSTLSEFISSMSQQFGQTTFLATNFSSLSKQISGLVLVLSFMLISFFLITIAPTMARRMEREMEEEFE